MRALGSSKVETGTVRECSRASQYRLSCTGQFSKFPAELRTCCRCSRKKLADFVAKVAGASGTGWREAWLRAPSCRSLQPERRLRRSGTNARHATWRGVVPTILGHGCLAYLVGEE